MMVLLAVRASGRALGFLDGCVLTEPTTLWAEGIYDTDESLNRVDRKGIYICFRLIL